MNLQSVKKASEIALSGITAELEHHNGSIRAVTLRDSSGGLLRVTGDYSMNVLVPAPPTLVKKYRLSGTFAGLAPVNELFDSEYEAKDRLREYERKHSGDASEVGLKIDPVEVPEEQ